VLRKVKVEVFGGILDGFHQGMLDRVEDLVFEVPRGSEEGSRAWEQLKALQEERQRMEEQLTTLGRVKWNHALHICSVQSLPSNVHVGENGEVLQTPTISPEDVRKALDGRKDAMMAEYRSLKVDRCDGAYQYVFFDSKMVEFVPAKLVCAVKSGPNFGKRKARAVICGNLAGQAAGPPQSIGTCYASGAGAILIKAAISHAIQHA